LASTAAMGVFVRRRRRQSLRRLTPEQCCPHLHRLQQAAVNLQCILDGRPGELTKRMQAGPARQRRRFRRTTGQTGFQPRARTSFAGRFGFFNFSRTEYTAYCFRFGTRSSGEALTIALSVRPAATHAADRRRLFERAPATDRTSRAPAAHPHYKC